MNKNILVITCCIFIACSGKLYAQNKNISIEIPVFNSTNGPVLLFAGNRIKSQSKDSKGAQYTLTRMEQKTGVAKQLPLPGMAKDFSSFKKITGETITKQLQHQLKLNNEAALWQFIQSHPDLNAYGLMAFSVPFRVAMGTAYIDAEVKDKKGETFTYAVQVGGTGNNTFTSTITIGQTPDFNSPQLSVSKVTDSIVTIHWNAKVKRNIPYFAFVFRQTGDRGDFIKLPARVIVNRKRDSAFYLFNEKVNANSAYKYFIRPADLIGNEGAFNSDTVSLVAANFHKLPVITQLKATD